MMLVINNTSVICNLSSRNNTTMIGKLTEAGSEEVLKQNVFGHVGCNDGFNTYIFPINYVFDGRHIICHSHKGSKVQIMQRNKRVCFQVDDVKDFIHWKSVMVLGQYQELHDSREKYNAMKLFSEHMIHLKSKKEVSGVEIQEKPEHPGFANESQYVIYRIVIDEISGRYEDGY